MKNILQQQFKAGYNRTAFITNVLRPIFQGKVKDFTIYDDKGSQPIPLTDSEKAIAKSIVKYGKLVTADERTIDLYEVIIHDNKIIERNKVSVGALIKKQIIGNNAIFVNFAYENPENKNWRFSFIAYDSVFEDGDIKTVQTNPKRYTYIFGEKEETYKTALDCFSKLADEFEIKIAKIKDAFGVEAMSKAFFDEYRDRHYKNFINHILHSNYKIAAFDGDEKAIRDFVKKLLGRIVFLYFLQKKGWLGASSTNYTDGDKNFISNFFKEAKQGADFYPVWLSKLFFDTLNEKRIADNFTMPDGKEVKIPYLNGGLFERESAKYDFITFDSELFINLFEFFDQYNFTVYEDSPDDHTVAVDPEMLGHIFENLLEDNKDKGAFYTPKQIVQYMTQESLIEYLITHLKSTDKDKLSAFVKDKTSELSKDELETIDKLLDDVKICDPAIGSGAFPMGLLQEIFGLKEKIHYELNVASPSPSGRVGVGLWSPATVKENIIQNSIYGVDIEKGAVDIARLRFWLSLIVDEDLPKALPNLDYKIVVGNSLVSKFEDQIIEIDWDLDTVKEGLFGSNLATEKNRLLEEISKKQRVFFHTESKDKKKITIDIRNLKIDLLKNQLNLMCDKQNIPSEPKEADYKNKTKAKFVEDYNRYLQTIGWKNIIKNLDKLKNNPELLFNHFDWKLDFPEILNPLVNESNVGFDIVIGNPPYIQLQKNGGFLAKQLEKAKYETYEKTGDIYCVFYEKGIQLLKLNGILTYITSNKWMRAGYGESLRDFFVKRTNPLLLIDFAGQKIFETATVDTNILITQNSTNQNKTTACVVKEKWKTTLTDYVIQNASTCSFSIKSSWVILNPMEQLIKQKIEKIGTPLKDWDVQINYGIKTGYNEAFIIDGNKKDELIAQDPKSVDIIRPILRGRDIKRYSYEFAELYLIATFPSKKYDIENYPAIKEHLLSFGYDRLKQTGDVGARKKTNNQWFETQDSISYWEDFYRQVIIYNDIAQNLTFALSDNGLHFNNTIYFIKADEKYNNYFLAILNSKIIDWYYRTLSVQLGQKAMRLFTIYVEQIPIPRINNIEHEKTMKIINENQGKELTFENSEKLTHLIYKLYELTEDEIKFINEI